MSKISIHIIALVAVVTVRSMAGPTLSDFETSIRESSRTGEMKSRVLYLHDKGNSPLAGETLEALQEIAQLQASNWGDTILEGDFDSEGSTRLDRVEGLYEGRHLFAFRITYSERAWYLGDCFADMKTAPEKCPEGRITESAFVAPTLKEWVRDDRAFAKFQLESPSVGYGILTNH